MHKIVLRGCSAIIVVVGVLLAGCSGNKPYVPSAVQGPTLLKDLSQAAPVKFKGVVFIADTSASAVWICPTADLRRGFQQPSDQLTGVSHPVQMAVDASGTLYVANAQVALGGVSNVTIYPRGKRTPVRTLSTGLNTATGIAVDSAGSVYVSNKFAGSIVKFLKGHGNPALTITENLVGPDGLAVDRDDDLFIADGSANDVLELKRGTTTPQSLKLKGLARPIGVAVDSRDNLYVSNLLGDKSRVKVYAPGSATPDRSFIVYGPVFNGASIGETMMLSIAPGDILLASVYLSLAYSSALGWGGWGSAVGAYAPDKNQALWDVFPGGSTGITPDDAVFQPGGQ